MAHQSPDSDPLVVDLCLRAMAAAARCALPKTLC